MGKRYEYLDYSKGLGILLIIFAHCIQYFEPMQGLNGYVISFHVPIFFLVAGCLANYHSDRNINANDFICKRARSLLIPYAIFSLFNSFLKLGVLFAKGSLTHKALSSEMTALFITGNGAVWFLVTLFGIEMLYLLLQIFKLNKKFSGVLFYLIGIIALIIPYAFGDVTNPFAKVLIRIIAGFGYFAFGYLIVGIIKKVSNTKVILSSLMLMLIGTTAYCLFGCSASFFDARFENLLPSIICSLCIDVGIILMFYVIEQKNYKNIASNFLEFCGKNSLIIMLVHPTILLFFTYPLSGFISKCIGIKGVIVSLILFVVIVALEMPFIWLINNKLPWLIGKVKNR